MGIIYWPQSRYKENKDKMLILGWQWLGESHRPSVSQQIVKSSLNHS